jgi:hypothetical protein
VFAKLLLGLDREETVRLVDVSDTGLRLLLPRSTPLTLAEALSASIVLRTRRDGEDLQLHVALVRIAATTPREVDLAFQFGALTADEVTRLHDLRSLFFL